MPTRDSEKDRVAAGAGLVSMAKVIGGLTNLLVIVTLTRLLDKKVFAVVALVYLLQETINALGTLGIPSSLLYFVPKLGRSSEKALGLWSGILLLGLAVPFAAVLWLGGPWIESLLNKPGIAMPLAYLAVYILADFPGQALPNYLLAKRAYRSFFGVTTYFYGSRMLSLVVPAAMGMHIEGIMFWFAMVALSRAGLFLFYILAVERGGTSKQGWSTIDLLSYGVPLSLSGIVGKLNIQIDKYMVAALCTAEVFAVYTVGAIELPLVPSIAYSITEALVPTLVIALEKGDENGFLDYWHGAMVKVAAIMMPVFFFFFILAGPAMRVLFSSGYSEASLPFRIYLCLLPMRLCAYGGIVRALGKTKPVLWASVVALAVNAGLNYPLFLAFGVAGPAAASVLAQFTAIFVLLCSIRSTLGLSWWKLLPFRGIAKTGSVAALSAVPLLFLQVLVRRDGLLLGLGAAILLAAYLLLGRLAGVITRQDITYVKDLVTLKIVKKAGGR